jgi:hypothetical protein
MNPLEQPTPRTDAALYPMNGVDIVWPDFARTLERELTETERQRFGADADRRQLRCDLSDAKAEASHYMAVAQKTTDELIFFRADNLKAHQMTCAAGLERDSLRAEVERLTPYVSKAILTHGGTMLCSPQVGVAFNEQQARAEKAEAECDALAKDKARLDWLEKNWIHWPITQNEETIRAAIDAAMKNETNTP